MKHWHWGHTEGFLTGFLMGLAIMGAIWYSNTLPPVDSPEWVLPLDTCIHETEIAAETHAYAIVWMELNPDADWHNFGDIARQKYWELLHRSSAWHMKNRD